MASDWSGHLLNLTFARPFSNMRRDSPMAIDPLAIWCGEARGEALDVGNLRVADMLCICLLSSISGFLKTTLKMGGLKK